MKKNRRTNSTKHKPKRKRNFGNNNLLNGPEQEKKEPQDLEEKEDTMDEPVKEELAEVAGNEDQVVEQVKEQNHEVAQEKKVELIDKKKEEVQKNSKGSVKKEVLSEESAKEEPTKEECVKELGKDEGESEKTGKQEVKEEKGEESKNTKEEEEQKEAKEPEKKEEPTKEECIEELEKKEEESEKVGKQEVMEEKGEEPENTKEEEQKNPEVPIKKEELIKEKPIKQECAEEAKKDEGALEKASKQDVLEEKKVKPEAQKKPKVQKIPKVQKKPEVQRKTVETKKGENTEKKQPAKVVPLKKYARVDKKNSRKSMMGWIGSSVVIFVLVITYVIMSLYYGKHFYKDTKINGINVSHMTVQEVEKACNTKVKAYKLTLQENNGDTENIKGEDIGLRGVFGDNIKKLLGNQSGFAWPIQLFQTHHYEVEVSLNYDEKMLEKRFAGLKCTQEKNNIEPVNAYISDYSETGYKIVPEKSGSKIKKELLYKEIKKAIISLESVINLEKINCYEEAKIKAQDPKLLSTLKKMKALTKAKITYAFGDKIEIVDGKRISQWITVTKDGKVQLNREGVIEFVNYLARKYNTLGTSRWFKSSYGTTVEVRGGNYGWWLNQQQEVVELTDLILAGKKTKREPVYYQRAGQHGGSDIGNTYVEINIAKQKLLFYKEGKLIIKSDIVSGNISKNFGTPSGTYALTYKEREAVLTGRDYASPVDYWMPFNGNIGMHDASWRSAFGKDRYLQNGSHGCINLPIASAKKIYENIEKGVAVIVY